MVSIFIVADQDCDSVLETSLPISGSIVNPYYRLKTLRCNSLFNPPQNHIIASAVFIVTKIMIKTDFSYLASLE